MKREIKFRAWYEREKEMRYEVEFDSWGGQMNELNFIVDCLNEENFPLMQFVGLKDMNGEDIYEGDIVKSFDKIGEVCYHDLRATFIFHDVGNYNERLHDRFPLEIIGNVYENPELLKSNEIIK